MNVALKEWASVVNALELGSQILLLRKGGIAESASGGFKLRYPEFLFFPTFEHQHRDYLKTSYTKPLSSPSDSLEIGLIGRVSHVITAPSLADVRKLSDHHVWNDRFIDMRHAYKPDLPLHVVLVRALRLTNPVSIPNRPSYAGCKSWVHLTEEINAEPSEAVLGDRDYDDRCHAICALLGSDLPTMV